MNTFLEKTYSLLPIFLQNIGLTLIGYNINRKRFGQSFLHYLDYYKKNDNLSNDEIFEQRNKRLIKFINFAYNNSDYYKSVFNKIGVVPSDIKSYCDLAKLPITNKKEIKENYGSVYCGSILKDRKIFCHTSGTTGSGFKFYSTETADHEKWAVWWRYRLRHGLSLNTWSAHFSGNSIVPINQNKPPFWRYNYGTKQIFFSIYHLNENTVKYYIEELNKKNIVWLHGYPSVLSLLAKLSIQFNCLIDHQIKWCTLGAENVLSNHNTNIIKAFGVKPIQHYGMSECVANFSECVNGNLHVDEDFSAVEFLPIGIDDTYRVIGTNYTNYATPMIRYDTGDIVRMTNRKCNCGLPGRIIDSIDGRLEDYIILRNGSRIGRMDIIFKDLYYIKEAQIRQTQKGRILLNIVKNVDYDEKYHKAILDLFYNKYGDNLSVDIEYVDTIPRTKSGKTRFVISEIKE